MEPYEERVGWTEEANREGAEKQAAARAKKARGEKLSDEEAYYLNFKPQRPMTLEEYLKRYEKEAFEVLGTDLEAYPKYYAENRDYFYGGEGMYVMTVDEDCKAWGIANNDIRLLEKAVSCLEQGQEVERAERVLRRYTLCTFTRPEEWRQWLDTYRDKIFFTESGGWFFMVDRTGLAARKRLHAPREGREGGFGRGRAQAGRAGRDLAGRTGGRGGPDGRPGRQPCHRGAHAHPPRIPRIPAGRGIGSLHSADGGGFAARGMHGRRTDRPGPAAVGIGRNDRLRERGDADAPRQGQRHGNGHLHGGLAELRRPRLHPAPDP